MKKVINIKKLFKLLKSSKTESSFIVNLRKNLVTHMESHPFDEKAVKRERLLNKERSNIFNIFKIKTMPIIPILLIIALLGGGTVGTVAASQGSLPGDILYPVKILSEDAQVSLSFNEENKNQLRIKFAQKRMEEINKLIEASQNATSGELTEKMDKALDNFNKNIEKAAENSQKLRAQKETVKSLESNAELLNALSVYKAELEQNREKVKEQNRERIDNALEKIKDLEDEKETESDEIDEDEKDEVASSTLQVAAQNKIDSVQNKIDQAAKFIEVEAQKVEPALLEKANLKLQEAKNKLEEARKLYQESKYEDSFRASQVAMRLAIFAKSLTNIKIITNLEKIEIINDRIQHFEEKIQEQGFEGDNSNSGEENNKYNNNKENGKEEGNASRIQRNRINS